MSSTPDVKRSWPPERLARSVRRVFCRALLTAVLATQLGGLAIAQSEPLSASPSAKPLLERALTALRSGDLSEARELLSEHLESSDDARAHMMLSRVLERQREPMEALTHARRAEELGEPAASLQTARLLARLGSRAAAYEATVRARAAQPRNAEAFLLGTLLLRDLGRGTEALELASQALESGITNGALYEQHALLALEEGSPRTALSSAEAGLKLAPENPRLHFAAAMATVESGDLSEPAIAQAIERLERSLELGIRNPATVELELADLLLAADRPSDALEFLVRASERSPTPEIFYKLALTYRQLGDEAAATRAVERFTDLRDQASTDKTDERSIGVRLNEIQQLAEANQLNDALARVEDLLVEHPDSADAHALEAKIAFSMQQTERAISSVRRAVSLAPGNAGHHYLEGLFLRLSGQREAAGGALRSALAIEPELAEAHALLGGIELEAGRAESAAEHFARAIDLGVSSADLHRAYAKALAELGRHAESKKQLDAAQGARHGVRD